MMAALRDFLRSDAAGGVVLIGAAVAALIVSNSPLAPAYFAMLQFKAGPLSVLHWINDGLMAVFFLLVGLEIKREFLGGRLASWGDRVSPLIAAAAGMAAPAIVYLVVSGDRALAHGWAIPAATDIAFALGLIGLLGNRVPVALKLFLKMVAIIDDLGAIMIIALVYTAALNTWALLCALAVFALMMIMNHRGVRDIRAYALGFAALWMCIAVSGIHATVAGVLTALAVPLTVRTGISPLRRIEAALNPWVAFGILPLFGFANAGVTFGEAGPIYAPLPLSIALALILGKQLGIFSGVWLAVKSGVAVRPSGASWAQLYGIALLCGVGFTMSLFIGGLAFADLHHTPMVKIGVLVGSGFCAVAGLTVLRFASPRP